MSDQKQYRIKQVATDFNISTGTLLDFLEKKGYGSDLAISSKISQDIYDIVADEYRRDQAIKVDSLKVARKVRAITQMDHHKEQQPEEEPVEEVIITSAVLSSPEKQVKTPEPVPEETVTVIKPEIPEIKVIGKIDLDEKKPKTRTKPKQEKTETPKVEPEKRSATPSEPEKKKKTPEKKSATPAPEEKPKESKQIKTHVRKLPGPKIVGHIDISQFEKKEKPKSDRSDKSDKSEQQVEKRSKGKRERIQNSKRVDVTKAHQEHKKQKESHPGGKGRYSKKDRFKSVRPEIDEDEVQKQIKETYARMTEGRGKTKGSRRRREKREIISQKAQEEQILQELSSNVLKVTEFVTANELAILMNNTPVTKVIEACMNLGMMVSINQRLDAETLVLVAEEFGYEIEFVTVETQGAIEQEEDKEEDMVERPPIVTVMGHVDHGKTSLLDYIRKANVIAGEAGGITQHIGAYNVQLPSGRRITFLDTPGHEAFTAMRARGAKVTDVAIIIVAADDAIMPQTVEAISHAQAAGVPMIFAINKIDKPGANPEKIKEQLANMNILVEDWGGKYQCQEISAKKGINIKELLEKVLLEADLLELKANPDKRAVGSVIESSLDKGRGYLATVLIESGTLRVGDVMLAGCYTGRVKAMFNERGQQITEAGPSTPVSVLGLNGAPTAGDTLNVLEDEKEARDIANKREQLIRIQGIHTQPHITLEEIGRRIALGNFKELNIIVKADVDGSVEALADSLIKLSTEEVQVKVIHKAVGAISENDVMLASASNAVIIGFQVRPSMEARRLAESESIEIRIYSVIYDAIEEVKSSIEGMLAPLEKEEVTATAEVREIFKISRVGTIAGCMVKEGKLTRTAKIRVIRDGIVIYTGKLGSLKRFKDDVKEVASGFDCGLNIDGFNDVKIGDIIEAYTIVEIKRKL
ncbi:MAG TPA: translation initiation factor IF-2 [Bacteroidales bacterium]|jgi:translation initiation factor IF-2|nr:translation initiation factor IF-2 [Bacteroidales bacterium]HKM12309.1 translation initiation factor IF-2 [Bacteroidales bacterium]HPB89519.1 translation initiation factor IF-2 [Bacteroidales bacterium]HPY22319.1 translation initiation factor IF-2 [Bacteroidales bacterium]HQA93503.1 translation initiation factor IF-2 [Bacteroidales bacterium]